MKKSFFTVIMSAILAAAVFMLVSCGNSDGSVSRVKHAGCLKVGYVSGGVSDEDMPFVSDDGGIISSPVQSAAGSLRVKEELVPVCVDDAYDKLIDGTVDCLWNVCSPSKQYVSAVRTISTDIYSKQVIVTVSNSDINHLADVKGKKLAVVSGSDAFAAMNEAKVMNRELKSMTVCGDLNEVVDDLRCGKVDCAAVGNHQAMYLEFTYPKEFKVTDSVISESMLVIAFRSEDEQLCECVAKQYIKMMKNSEISDIWKKYVGGDYPRQISTVDVDDVA